MDQSIGGGGHGIFVALVIYITKNPKVTTFPLASKHGFYKADQGKFCRNTNKHPQEIPDILYPSGPYITIRIKGRAIDLGRCISWLPDFQRHPALPPRTMEG